METIKGILAIVVMVFIIVGMIMGVAFLGGYVAEDLVRIARDGWEASS